MKKPKFVLLISTLLAASWSTFAGDASGEIVEITEPFSGFYISGGIGAQNNSAKDFYDSISITSMSDPLPTTIGNGSINSIGSKTRLHGAVMAGYGQQIADSGFYLGGQVGINLGNFNLNNTKSYSFENGLSPVDVSTSANLKMNTAEFITDFKPGYIFSNNVMLYGLFGLAVNQAKVGYNSTIAGEGFESQLSNSHKKTVTGLRFGAGIEKMVSNDWGVGFNYVYTEYRPSVSVRDTVTIPTEDPLRVNKSVSSKFKKHAVMFTVSRYFA